MTPPLGLKPIRSAALLIAALLVASDYALIVETCGNNVTKYLDCIDDRFWSALEQQMETEMKKTEMEVSQCFTTYECAAPQITGDQQGGDRPLGGPPPHGPKEGRPPRPPPLGRPPRYGLPPPPPPFKRPGPMETTIGPFSTLLPSTETSPEPEVERFSFKKPFGRFGPVPMFITKLVLNDEFFPGSNGRELSETFGECMRPFDDQQRALFRECLREEMPGFTEPKNGVPAQCNTHIQGGTHRLFHQRHLLDGLERYAFDYLNLEGSCTSKNVPLVRKCLSNTFNKAHKSSFDIMTKAKDVKVLRCQIGSECLSEMNPECRMDIKSFGSTACGCLAKQKDAVVDLACNYYEKCTGGFKPKRELVDEETGSKIEMFCRNYEESESLCEGI